MFNVPDDSRYKVMICNFDSFIPFEIDDRLAKVVDYEDIILILDYLSFLINCLLTFIYLFVYNLLSLYSPQ
jgi:hypothetical protein